MGRVGAEVGGLSVVPSRLGGMTSAPATHADNAWAAVWGQPAAVEQLKNAAANPAEMTHAWLITGPPGSGRSTLAYAFAATLIARDPGDDHTIQQVLAGTHPDLVRLRTEGVIIPVKEVRAAAARSYLAPSVGRHRVVVIEDADRMAEQASNAILKALEEPPPETVWILCAPSDVDLLPTIRSRVRMVRLAEPDVVDVAELIVRRTGADPVVAEQSARHAQRHIGMAQRLATNPVSRERREKTLRDTLRARTVADVVEVSAAIVQAATDDAKTLTTERDAAEYAELLRTAGITDGAAVPPAVRSQVKALEDEQKKRATRSVRDGIDRVLTDLQSLFRDVVLCQFGRTDDMINRELEGDISFVASAWPPERTLAVLDAIADTRDAIEQNAAPLLALESLLVTITTGRTP